MNALECARCGKTGETLEAVRAQCPWSKRGTCDEPVTAFTPPADPLIENVRKTIAIRKAFHATCAVDLTRLVQALHDATARSKTKVLPPEQGETLSAWLDIALTGLLGATTSGFTAEEVAFGLLERVNTLDAK